MKGGSSVAKVKKAVEPTAKFRPALTPEARENQLISLAFDRAEEQLRSGTASSQVISHFLKLATEKTQLEREKLRKENELLLAKTSAIQSSQKDEEFYKKVLNAMRRYSGQGDMNDEYDEY